MKVPQKPKAGSVLVVENHYYEEFQPEVVHVAESMAAAYDWVDKKLAEEPGGLYMVCPVNGLRWAEVKVRRRYRKGSRWVRRV